MFISNRTKVQKLKWGQRSPFWCDSTARFGDVFHFSIKPAAFKLLCEATARNPRTSRVCSESVMSRSFDPRSKYTSVCLSISAPLSCTHSLALMLTSTLGKLARRGQWASWVYAFLWLNRCVSRSGDIMSSLMLWSLFPEHSDSGCGCLGVVSNHMRNVRARAHYCMYCSRHTNQINWIWGEQHNHRLQVHPTLFYFWQF